MIKLSKAGIDALIRIATVDESRAIASVLEQAFKEYEPLYTEAAFAATTPTANEIERRWDESPVWLAVQSKRIVGTVPAGPKNSGLYIRSMAVLSTARGQGIAWQLLKEIQDFAGKHRHQHLYLSTTPFLQRAIRLYEQFGFVRTNEGPYDLHGTPLFTMEKLLTSSQFHE